MPLNVTRDGHSHFPMVTSGHTQHKRSKILLASEVDTSSALSGLHKSAIFAFEWVQLQVLVIQSTD